MYSRIYETYVPAQKSPTFFVNFVDEKAELINNRHYDIMYNGQFDKVPSIGHKVRIKKNYYRVSDVLEDIRERAPIEYDSNGDEIKVSNPVWYYVFLKECY